MTCIRWSATMVPALYMIFLFAPTEALQGNAQRIFYIHVPLAAIGAYGSAFLLFIGCVGFLITNDLKWDRFAACSAEMGEVFTSAQLLTAMMWAKPIWGIWYTFDARGTLQLVLLLIFISYFMLRAYLPDREKRAKLIHAEGEFAASQRLADAAKILGSEAAALQLRYLQTLTEIGVEKNTTIVFPIPIDILSGLVKQK